MMMTITMTAMNLYDLEKSQNKRNDNGKRANGFHGRYYQGTGDTGTVWRVAVPDGTVLQATQPQSTPRSGSCGIWTAVCCARRTLRPMYRYLVAWNIRNGSVYQGEWTITDVDMGRRHTLQVVRGRGTVVPVVANVVLRMVLRRIKIEVMITTATAAALLRGRIWRNDIHGYGTMVCNNAGQCVTRDVADGKPTGFGRYREPELYVTKDCGTRDDLESLRGWMTLIQLNCSRLVTRNVVAWKNDSWRK
jgi:hypothetical protein